MVGMMFFFRWCSMMIPWNTRTKTNSGNLLHRKHIFYTSIFGSQPFVLRGVIRNLAFKFIQSIPTWVFGRHVSIYSFVYLHPSDTTPLRLLPWEIFQQDWFLVDFTQLFGALNSGSDFVVSCPTFLHSNVLTVYNIYSMLQMLFHLGLLQWKLKWP